VPTAAQAEHQVEGRLLLDVVVRERAAILQLLAGEDQALLVRRDALLVLDLGLDILDRVGRLNLKGHSLACQVVHSSEAAQESPLELCTQAGFCTARLVHPASNGRYVCGGGRAPVRVFTKICIAAEPDLPSGEEV
jgi:hypothetical protein